MLPSAEHSFFWVNINLQKLQESLIFIWSAINSLISLKKPLSKQIVVGIREKENWLEGKYLIPYVIIIGDIVSAVNASWQKRSHYADFNLILIKKKTLLVLRSV